MNPKPTPRPRPGEHDRFGRRQDKRPRRPKAGGPLAVLVGSHRGPGFERVRATYGRMDVDRDKVTGWFSSDPLEMVETYAESWKEGTQTGHHNEINDLWDKYGSRTIDTMIDGCKTLAMLWDSAWKEGNGDDIASSELTERDEETLLTEICDKDKEFFTSTGLDGIKDRLT